MGGPRSCFHLISLLSVLLSTGTSATRLPVPERGEIGIVDGEAANGIGHGRLNAWGGGGVTESYCYACGNVGGIVISLPAIGLPGLLAIGLPTISIGTSGIQIGGYPGMIGYIPGYGYTPYTLCCVPLYGSGTLFTASSDQHSAHNQVQDKQGIMGHNLNKHVVKPNMHMGKQTNAKERGDDSHGEYNKAYNMPPTPS